MDELKINKRLKILGFLLALHLYTFIPLSTTNTLADKHLLYAGDNAAAFLRTGVGARMLGMGSSGVVLAQGANAIYWNPALLSLSNKRCLDTTFVNKFDLGIEYGFVGFTSPIKSDERKLGVIGFGLIRQSVGGIEKSLTLDINNRPVIDGEFTSCEEAFYLSYARPVIADIKFGANIKYIYQKLYTEEARGIGIDIGAYKSFLNTDKNMLSIGINMQDINHPDFKWSTGHKDKIPVILKTGLAYTCKVNRFHVNDINLEIDGNKRESRPWKINIGAECWFLQYLGARIGYNNEEITFGGTIKYKFLYIDYAFTPHTLGDTHWFSIGGKF